MKLNEFLQEFDKEGSVILLEGKVKVKEADIPKLIALGKLLTENSKFMRFRSGNAAGSDEYFSMGVAEVNPDRLEVVAPYSGHRKYNVLSKNIIALDELDMSKETKLIEQSSTRTKMTGLIKMYVDGDRRGFVMKAAYIIRDTLKVLGAREFLPATFGIFYDNLEKPISGGTGHTINMCRLNNIRDINQTVWFDWLEEQASC